ncbi:MAG: tRNA uridine-5-carboxymethylaminomethyl(34) synthesis enzyme MnmG [Nannocystaceae bacterium]|nr:tRNA uridine-5-carboxymethylaminomethyl(34) synthesis enzyme MnmG [Nannocystaceae bacterium]
MPRFTLPDDIEPPPPLIEQVDCHLTWTNANTNAIIGEHLHESPMYSGQIEGRGPRYCPSIEDKVVRFADRDRHQVFLEPEGLDTHSVYPNGISTSLPAEVQAKFIVTIPGLENAKILRPGYAVEYDAVDARALDHRFSSKAHHGLYFAGQVNGTSGYEEAGIQGLLAGANAALELLERDRLIVGRDEGYAGVLVDDLVTQGCDEPYRMFTSRAEYRIMLREDNADARLSGLALSAGLISQARVDRVHARRAKIDTLCAELSKKRSIDDAPAWLRGRAKAQHTYAGYLDRMRAEVARLRGDAATDLPLAADLDYAALEGLSNEAKQRLIDVRPTSTAQASRIPGMTPAALMCLWAHARRAQRQAGRASAQRVGPRPGRG